MGTCVSIKKSIVHAGPLIKKKMEIFTGKLILVNEKKIEHS